MRLTTNRKLYFGYYFNCNGRIEEQLKVTGSHIVDNRCAMNQYMYWVAGAYFITKRTACFRMFFNRMRRYAQKTPVAFSAIFDGVRRVRTEIGSCDVSWYQIRVVFQSRSQFGGDRGCRRCGSVVRLTALAAHIGV